MPAQFMTKIHYLIHIAAAERSGFLSFAAALRLLMARDFPPSKTP